MEVNHDEEVVDTERFDISREIEDVTLDSMQPAEHEVAKRLTTPIVNTYLDTRHIAFERYGPPPPQVKVPGRQPYWWCGHKA